MDGDELMPRARNIKPAFFSNDELAEIEPVGRLLFIGLWTLADREGRLQDRPKKIKAEILPYDDCAIDDLLNALHERGFIIRYTANECAYIQVVNFEKHQNPHVKEPASEIPAPDGYGASMVQAPDKHRTSRADSGYRIPDSGLLIPEYMEWFKDFWFVYPRKEARKRAEDSWRALKPDKALTERIIADVIKRKASRQWQKDNGEFIPHASTYLNQRRWNDEETDNRPPNPHPGEWLWDAKHNQWRPPHKVGWVG